MSTDTLTFMQDTLRYLGFGESMVYNEELEQKIHDKVNEFQLKTEARFDEWSKIEAILHFKKADTIDSYFFNKYDAFIVYDDRPTLNKKQTFYISRGKGVTFKEAYNLLQGRSVYKSLLDPDGVKYYAWIQLKFNERTPNNTNYKTHKYGEHYGYDLEKALENYPIRELKDETLRSNLLYSLKKGNAHPVTFLKATKIEKMFVEACPMYKTLIIYSEVTRSAHRQTIPKEQSMGVPLLFPDPETTSGNGEKEEGKKEEKDPPFERWVPVNGSNGSSARKRSRRPDSL